VTVISENAKKLLEKRYFLRDTDGNLLENSWSDVCRRVAHNIASVEKDSTYWEEIFYNRMNEMEFIPSSPCLFNAGTTSQQLSSCFIVDIEDNIESIFNTVAECAKIFQKCGGAGLSMQKIRPRGEACVSSGSNASGVISFMRIFNSVVNEVKQGNKRNGALKIDLNVEHPEIFDFIHCKDNTYELNNMNISVSLTSEFINAVENNLDWDLKFKGKIYRTVKARDLWNEIITSAWKTGEPGISYQTNMNNGNMNPHLDKDVYGNPCHEFVNIPYSSCNLASINLTDCISNGKIDKIKLKENITITVRFLDDMITANKLPLQKIQNTTENIRPIGLGTMSFGNLLYELGIPYNSEECLVFTKKLYSQIYDFALEANMKLAEEKGSYPAWENSKWDKKLHRKVRCSSQLSIAPNGSIAFIANTTGGIEPEFALVHFREDNEGTKYPIINAVFEKYLKGNNLFTQEILTKIGDNQGSIKGLDDIFSEDIQKIFVTASDISPEWHVRVLAEIQNFVDLSISKTVNLPNNATKDEIGDIYLMAGKLGIKGVTVYRDGSRDSQVLTTNSTKKPSEIINEVYNDFPRGFIEEVPVDLVYRKYKLKNGCGKLYFFVGVDETEGKIYDVFTNTDAVGGCTVNTQANSRLLSAGLRGGIPVEYLIAQIDKSGACASYQSLRGKQTGMTKIRNMILKDVSPDVISKIDEMIGTPVSAGKSCPSSIAMVLKNILKEFEGLEHEQINYQIITKKEIEVLKEHECKHERMRMVEGCMTCPDCGYSLCN